jgi:hypothetical protein
MSDIEEPDISRDSCPEGKFREAVINAIEKILEDKKEAGSLVEYFRLEDFGLDIAFFMEWSDNRSTVRFLELKAFVGSRKGGVGFGDAQGRGLQVDILYRENSQLELANRFIRWLLVDCTRNKGSERFVIFDNIQAEAAAMGGVGRRKQNNFRINALIKNATTWDRFLKKLEEFLISHRGKRL